MYDGKLISGLGALVDAKLKGVQLNLQGPPRAYRAAGPNGLLALCDRHLDLRRAKGEAWALTGKSSPARLCDDCEDDMERGRR